MTRLAEATAFLDLFARSGWASCHVRTADLELFVAARPDQLNPMTERVPAAASSDDVAAVPLARSILSAPHLGTVVSLAAVGETVAAGAAYATLDLLGDAVVLTSDRAGRVVEQLAPLGVLAEFDQPLLAIG